MINTINATATATATASASVVPDNFTATLLIRPNPFSSLTTDRTPLDMIDSDAGQTTSPNPSNNRRRRPPPNPNPNPNPSPPQRQPLPLPLPPPTNSRSQLTRSRSVSTQPSEETITPPFPWATDRPATLHTLEYLTSKGIASITGDTVCRRCEHRVVVSYDLVSKFAEMKSFIETVYSQAHDRAPPEWTNPVLGECPSCKQSGCMKPVIAADKDEINWLFLFLAQMVGCCTLDQLKYFCSQAQKHRTGAKDRVLFSTYLKICQQLDPEMTLN